MDPQQNTVVNSQLESAQETEIDIEHERRVREFADAIASDRPDDADGEQPEPATDSES